MDRDEALRLFLARRGLLIGYILSIVRDGPLAEDVFQELSLILLRKHREIRDREHLEGWIRATARLESLSALRARRKAPIPLAPAILDLLEGEWARPERRQAPARIEALRRCLDRLGPRARRLLDMRFREGRSGQELAAAMESPLNTVYVSLSRIYRGLEGCVRARLAGGEASRA